MSDKWGSSKAADIYLYFVTFAASKHLPVFDTLFVFYHFGRHNIYRYEGVARQELHGTNSDRCSSIQTSKHGAEETVGKKPTEEQIQNLCFLMTSEKCIHVTYGVFEHIATKL